MPRIAATLPVEESRVDRRALSRILAILVWQGVRSVARSGLLSAASHASTHRQHRRIEGRVSSLLYLVAGARPNFMKIAPIVRAIQAQGQRFTFRIIHTGQHHDRDMNDV